jgi:hypothetical protein
MALGHAGVGMSELARDHRHGDPAHGEDRGVGMPQNVEPDRRRDAARAQASRIGRNCSARFQARPSSRRSSTSPGERPAISRSMSSGASSVKVT